MKLIGFMGPIGCGKSTAARQLILGHGYIRVRFADPLKGMLLSLGLSQSDVDGDTKEVPHELLCGMTPRHAMQTLGTEWGRTFIGRDFWINAWGRRVRLSNADHVVVDDVRFPNEAQAIRDMGGMVVRIERVGGKARDSHISEKQEIVPDVSVLNYDMPDFLRSIDKLARD
jgi:hypothetical protein